MVERLLASDVGPLSQVDVQCPAKMQVHELHAKTDTENRALVFGKRVQHRALPRNALGLFGLARYGLPPRCRSRGAEALRKVSSASEHEARAVSQACLDGGVRR